MRIPYATMAFAVKAKMAWGGINLSRYHVGMNKLRLFREIAGLSQGELAKAIKSNQARISNWEKEPSQKGYRQIPLQKAKEASVVLNCLLTELRPDLLATKSIDLLLEGAPAAIRDDIRDYAIYKLKQPR